MNMGIISSLPANGYRRILINKIKREIPVISAPKDKYISFFHPHDTIRFTCHPFHDCIDKAYIAYIKLIKTILWFNMIFESQKDQRKR
jgi:hypothetical protein